MKNRQQALRQFYRMRVGTGLLLAMPGMVLALWWSWTVWASLNGFRHAIQATDKIDSPLFQTGLHDLLDQELKRLKQPAALAASGLPIYQIDVESANLPELLQTPVHPFVPAQIGFQSRSIKAEVRLRGQKAWHLSQAKKSLRIKLVKEELIQGNRVFNLSPASSPMLIDEKMIFDLARDIGLMTTESEFVRLRFNGLDLGVFALTTPVTEMIQRRHRHIPGDIYALDELPAGWSTSHWSSPGRWKQVSAYDPHSASRANLERLFNQLDHAPDQAFRSFVNEQLELKAFASLAALRLLFGDITGREQHYALSYDPYLGKWEPIVTEFNGFQQAFPTKDPDPLMRRLANVPEFQLLRQQCLQQLLQKKALTAALRIQASEILTRLSPDLSTDPYWQANRLFLPVDTLHAQLMRPMNLTLLQQMIEAGLETCARRRAWVDTSLPVVPEHVLEQKTLQLGPGRVEIPSTRIFRQPVRIAAGTQLIMGKSASLLFFAKVEFAGEAAAPIRIQSHSGERWGGIVIQGQATAGSQLRHLEAFGGSFPSWQQNHYPGMLNLHDSRDLALKNCRFGDNRGSDDLIHSYRVDRLSASHIRLTQAASDGWDLEYSSGRLEDIEIDVTGDDGLDLMGSELMFRKVQILASKGNGISVGEASRVHLSDSLIANSGVAAFVKNASSLVLANSLLFHNQTALRIKQASPDYEGSCRLVGNELYETGSQRGLEWDAEAQKQLPEPQLQRWQHSRTLDPLKQTLGLADWKDLNAWIQSRRPS